MRKLLPLFLMALSAFGEPDPYYRFTVDLQKPDELCTIPRASVANKSFVECEVLNYGEA